MESSVHIFPTNAGGGTWAWSLYVAGPAGSRALRACEVGFESARAAKEDYATFVSAATGATVRVTRKEVPDEPKQRPSRPLLTDPAR